MTDNGGTARRVAGRYRLERKIGRGGAGAVWRAHDERLDRPVAVKQIPIAPDAEASSRSRALREARAAARLRVPNVVQVYDVIEDDANAYLIMELVDAPNLSTLVRRRGPLEAPTAAAMGLQILDALEAAHRVGILHRDVKPSNVLIDDDTPRLTDFGIARLGDDPALTSTGVVMGTPAYIAPEHARGEDIGPAIDLYGLGATLYYAVEGESPFGGEGSLSTVMAVVSSPPRPMTRAGPLTDLLTELLSKDPGDRPEADEIRRRLRRIANSAGHARTRVLPVPPTEPGNGEVRPDGPVTVGAAPAGAAGAAGAAKDATATEDTGASTGAGADADHDDAHRTNEVATVPPQDRDTPRAPPVPRSDRRPALFAVALVLLLAALLSMRLLGGGGDDGGGNDGQDDRDQQAAAAATQSESEREQTAGTPSEPEEESPEPPTEATPSPSPSPSEEEEDEGDGVLPATDAEIPDDWDEFTPGDLPYRIFHPPGWTTSRLDATRTDIRDPDSGTYLRLDWVDDRRDPIGAWEEYEPTFAGGHANYERIGLTETTYQGNPAALWEYRYEEGGVALHAYNLGVNADENGFSLTLQSHEDNWEQAREELWPLFLSSYRFEP
jgi:hypothetical protein